MSCHRSKHESYFRYSLLMKETNQFRVHCIHAMIAKLQFAFSVLWKR